MYLYKLNRDFSIFFGKFTDEKGQRKKVGSASLSPSSLPPRVSQRWRRIIMFAATNVGDANDSVVQPRFSTFKQSSIKVVAGGKTGEIGETRSCCVVANLYVAELVVPPRSGCCFCSFQRSTAVPAESWTYPMTLVRSLKCSDSRLHGFLPYRLAAPNQCL